MNSCDEVEALRNLHILVTRSVLGRCEAVVNARTRCGWVKFGGWSE